jgi:hypothetical protein
MLEMLKRIDVPKLAGIKTILGVDLTSSYVNVVELTNRGSVLNRHRPDFRVLRTCSLRFDPSWSLEERATQFKHLLHTRSIRTRFAFSSVQSPAIKYLRMRVPSDVTQIDEWLQEHIKDQLKLPIPIDSLAISYEVISAEEEEREISIAMLRKDEVKKTRDFFSLVGLELLGLNTGVSDLAHAALAGDKPLSELPVRIHHIAPDSETIITTKHRRMIGIASHLLIGGTCLSVSASIDSEVMAEQHEDRFCGEISGLDLPNEQLFVAGNLSPELSLAYALAIRGHLSAYAAEPFLNSGESHSSQEIVYKALALRTVFAAGALIIGLLAIQVPISVWLDSKAAELDAKVNASGALFAHVTALEVQVRSLESQSGFSSKGAVNSNVSKVLHDLARETPENLYLTRLAIRQAGKKNELTFSASGQATTIEFVTTFLKNLTASHLCREVSLARFSTPSSESDLTPVRFTKNSTVTFEMNGVIAMGNP